jgi:hypothetical protein
MPDGHERGWHSDEPGAGQPTPPIVRVATGAARPFDINIDLLTHK